MSECPIGVREQQLGLRCSYRHILRTSVLPQNGQISLFQQWILDPGRGHCSLYLAQLFSEEAQQAFRKSFRAI